MSCIISIHRYDFVMNYRNRHCSVVHVIVSQVYTCNFCRNASTWQSHVLCDKVLNVIFHFPCLNRMANNKFIHFCIVQNVLNRMLHSSNDSKLSSTLLYGLCTDKALLIKILFIYLFETVLFLFKYTYKLNTHIMYFAYIVTY